MSIIIFQHDTELDKNVLLSVIIVVEDMTKPQDADLPPDQKDLIYREIACKRTRASERRGRMNEQIVELKLKKKENVHMKGKIERERT